jgi:hypothetical protein
MVFLRVALHTMSVLLPVVVALYRLPPSVICIPFNGWNVCLENKIGQHYCKVQNFLNFRFKEKFRKDTGSAFFASEYSSIEKYIPLEVRRKENKDNDK